MVSGGCWSKSQISQIDSVSLIIVVARLDGLTLATGDKRWNFS